MSNQRSGRVDDRATCVPIILQANQEENTAIAAYMAAAWANGESDRLLSTCKALAEEAPPGDIGLERVLTALGLQYESRALASYGWARRAVRKGDIALSPLSASRDHLVVIVGEVEGAAALVHCPARGQIVMPWSALETSVWARAGEYGVLVRRT